MDHNTGYSVDSLDILADMASSAAGPTVRDICGTATNRTWLKANPVHFRIRLSTTVNPESPINFGIRLSTGRQRHDADAERGPEGRRERSAP